MCRKGWIAIVLLLALCTAGAASALPLDPEVAEASGETGLLDGLWERFLSWIGRVAGGEDELNVWEMDGCHLDPNGGCGHH
jgi:hypothetical protein